MHENCGLNVFWIFFMSHYFFKSTIKKKLAKCLTHWSMLEVILYPVQGRSVGEGSFNREVDICE